MAAHYDMLLQLAQIFVYSYSRQHLSIVGMLTKVTVLAKFNVSTGSADTFSGAFL